MGAPSDSASDGASTSGDSSSSSSSEREHRCTWSLHRRHAAGNIFLTVAAGAGAVLVAARSGAVDPGACIAAAYTLGLFCFQNTFLEWPRADFRAAAALLAAIGVFLLPSVLQVIGVALIGWRWAALVAADVLVIAMTYRIMVRGPSWSPGAGSLRDQVCIITGCNTGIGYETAEALACAGATVVFACRSEARARDAMKRLLSKTRRRGVREEQLRFLPLDLASFSSVRRFVELFAQSGLKLHLLILNAGVMLRNRTLSEDGIEMTLASSHFGHFLLVGLLLPHLLSAEAAGDRPRLVAVGSNMSYMHDAFDFSEAVSVTEEPERTEFLKKKYELFRAYGQAKLANVLFTTELAQRLRRSGSRIPANIVHPGEVLTEVMRDMPSWLLCLKQVFKPLALLLLKTPRQGSFCTLYVATAPELATADDASGAYFVRLSQVKANEAGLDKAAALRLWDISERIVGMPMAISHRL